MNRIQHPGGTPHPDDVLRAITNAMAQLPRGYQPRTRHWGGAEHRGQPQPEAPAGSQPNYANRLILSASPYLRQHAHNPVDWRPWGPEAFAEARAARRPIFLSIGYATCHWCHVMEHESFEDIEIASILNGRYVPIKVDREERPDVDAVYMAAVHAMHGQGGWPMSVWLAPDPDPQSLNGLPYFAGTYFPPFSGQRGVRYGFVDLLVHLADLLDTQPARVLQQGQQVADAVRAHLAGDLGGTRIGTEATDAVAREMASQFDGVHGGLRMAPKFPSQLPIRLLLRHALRTGDKNSLHMAHFTLQRMAAGGMYDHVGGGFHRYSTDAQWFAPHFEKMLYDQALIVLAALDALQATQDAGLERVVRETLDYLLRELRSDDGGLYSATDADSEGREGLYFLWTIEQLQDALGQGDAALVAEVYGATPQGNFEGSNILHRVQTDAEAAQRHGLTPAAMTARLRGALDRLWTQRQARVPPLRDDKILTAWNGLAISALARAGWLLAEPRYLQAAQGAASFVLQHLCLAGRLLRASCGGVVSQQGFLDDYAFFIAGLLDLYDATGAVDALESAIALQNKQDELLADARGGYFATALDAEPLLARARPDYDGAEPCGNSVSALNLVRLAALTGEDRFRQAAASTLDAFAGRLGTVPGALTEMLLAVEAQAWPLLEVVLVQPAGAGVEGLEPFERALRALWQPHRVVLRAKEGDGIDRLSHLAPPVTGKVALQGQVTAYVCRNGACGLPTTDPSEMARQLTARQV